MGLAQTEVPGWRVHLIVEFWGWVTQSGMGRRTPKSVSGGVGKEDASVYFGDGKDDTGYAEPLDLLVTLSPEIGVRSRTTEMCITVSPQLSHACFDIEVKWMVAPLKPRRAQALKERVNAAIKPQLLNSSHSAQSSSALSHSTSLGLSSFLMKREGGSDVTDVDKVNNLLISPLSALIVQAGVSLNKELFARSRFDSDDVDLHSHSLLFKHNAINDGGGATGDGGRRVLRGARQEGDAGEEVAGKAGVNCGDSTGIIGGTGIPINVHRPTNRRRRRTIDPLAAPTHRGLQRDELEGEEEGGATDRQQAMSQSGCDMWVLGGGHGNVYTDQESLSDPGVPHCVKVEGGEDGGEELSVADSQSEFDDDDDVLTSLLEPHSSSEVRLLYSPQQATHIKRYEETFKEIRQLGKGGFGTVVLVEELKGKGLYAIKKIPIDAHQGINHKLLRREAIHLGRVSHQNIVRYFSTWIEEVPRSSVEGKTATQRQRVRQGRKKANQGEGDKINAHRRRHHHDQHHQNTNHPTQFMDHKTGLGGHTQFGAQHLPLHHHDLGRSNNSDDKPNQLHQERLTSFNKVDLVDDDDENHCNINDDCVDPNHVEVCGDDEETELTYEQRVSYRRRWRALLVKCETQINEKNKKFSPRSLYRVSEIDSSVLGCLTPSACGVFKQFTLSRSSSTPALLRSPEKHSRIRQTHPPLSDPHSPCLSDNQVPPRSPVTPDSPIHRSISHSAASRVDPVVIGPCPQSPHSPDLAAEQWENVPLRCERGEEGRNECDLRLAMEGAAHEDEGETDQKGLKNRKTSRQRVRKGIRKRVRVRGSGRRLCGAFQRTRGVEGRGKAGRIGSPSCSECQGKRDKDNTRNHHRYSSSSHSPHSSPPPHSYGSSPRPLILFLLLTSPQVDGTVTTRIYSLVTLHGTQDMAEKPRRRSSLIRKPGVHQVARQDRAREEAR
eukprot:GHVN01093791.1.p1 GENE.GHVN01093791.1~~GHVN01093791.1.p1  ORF type:complete len:946 (+),score=232.10 GHVN01093791.1:127-2964(+)